VKPDFLDVDDLGGDGLARVLGLAANVKRDPDAYTGSLAGHNVGLFFEKPSTRTRVSCEVAVVRLGAHPVVLRQDEVGLGVREAIRDVARTLDRYLDVLAFRVFRHADLELLAAAAVAPVVNLLSDRAHPCQALADLQTIAERVGALSGVTVAYVGDGNNIAHSLLVAGAMAGMNVRVASPPGFEPLEEVVARARRLAATAAGSVVVGNDPADVVAGADVVYTDVWTSMGQEAEAEERRAVFSAFTVDRALFESAGPAAVFLHCLPAHRGEEVTDEVMEHERSLVFDQAENRMHSFAALLLHLAGAR